MPLSDRCKEKLIKMLQEEETDLYVLSMHYENDGDLNYFNDLDRKCVKAILDTLIQDTQRHAQMIKSILERD